MTIEEIEKLAKSEGFRPFAIVTIDGLRRAVPRPGFINIPRFPSEEPSYVVVYSTDQFHVAKIVNLGAIDHIDML